MGEALIDALTTLPATATNAISYGDLGLHPIAFSIGPLPIRWYSLAYLTGIVVGWWYLLRLLRAPGAPMPAW